LAETSRLDEIARERQGALVKWRLAAAVLVVAACGRGEAVSEKIIVTPEEGRAIAAAKRYVRENGYTSVIPDPKAIRPELMEANLPPSVIWERHHNTLRPEAVGISSGQGARQPGWTVYFEATRGGDGLRGVEMSPDLTQMWMCHYELRSDAPEKVVRPRNRASAE
jgi:hypothetical protein